MIEISRTGAHGHPDLSQRVARAPRPLLEFDAASARRNRGATAETIGRIINRQPPAGDDIARPVGEAGP